MRIIAGTLGGRQFSAPKGHRTHPMSDKMRGALFNILGDISGLSVLDAFAGSGALSFEALSRGARHATLIEVDKIAQQAIVNNLATLGLMDNTLLVQGQAASWSKNNFDTTFDLVLLDPPYNNLQSGLLQTLAAHTALSGIVVLSLPPKAGIILNPINYKLLTKKSYGDSELHIYQKLL